MDKLKIIEIFKSIQGESSYTGFPCTFIRLSGCNLDCTYCDTQYARSGGKTFSIDEIISRVKKLNCSLIEITGGEPLLQKEVYPLMKKLLELKYKVLIETNGSISLKHIPKKVIKIMDIKCPDSGMSDKMDFNNLKFLSNKDEIKFVIKSRRDYLWAKHIISQFSLNKKTQLLFSPVLGHIEPKKIAGWILKDNLPVRFQLQVHKIINIK
ncbi:MAG: radical SAM protein [Candidatus Firestonebacteria bacterium]|nr:radical SAM protein [Candidatus Firestonebacteria bacterium]